jgi:ubiquinone/menaquinone biosynthesis C-methylase UbiE
VPEFVNPNQILNQLNPQEDMIAADFGSGSGGWVIPLAKKLKKGRVFAVDLQEAPLSALKGRAKLEGLSNIKTIVADVAGRIPELGNSSCDLILMTDLLFQVDNQDKVFEEAKRVLKQNGRILIIEWNINSPLGPKSNKPSPERIKEIAKTQGFKIEKEFPAGDYHFGLMFIK